MKLNGMTIFCEKRKGPFCHIEKGIGGSCWPLIIKISSDIDRSYTAPDISFLCGTEEDIIAFKNSVLWAFEEYKKNR